MLNLILGRKLSGKTSYCINKASELAKNGKDVILLVPEQFSFECQKLLLTELGPSVSNRISIHSFTSLCREISLSIGGMAGKHIDEGIRFLLVGRAINNCRDNLKYYSRFYNSRDFQKKVMLIISELKQASVSSDTLKSFSEKVDTGIFSDKLYDISLILSAYDALLSNKFIEPFDVLEKTVSRMKDNSWFNGKTLFIDEFKGFTASQFMLLDRAVAGCDDVFAAFCCDSLASYDDTDIFKNVIECANRLKFSAHSHNVAVADDVFLDYCGYKTNELKCLEELCAQRQFKSFEGQAKNITVINSSTLYDEVDYCMRTIRSLVREKGYCFSDFVIISRNDSVYSTYVKDISLKYDIPCFVDKKIPLAELPMSIFVTSSVKAALSFQTEDILRFLKTGFCGLTDSEISKIENYAYIWNINSAGWLKQWKLNPDGLKENKNNESFDNVEYNRIREIAVASLLMLKNSLNGTVTDMCRSLFNLFEKCNLVEKLKEYTSKLELEGQLSLAEYQRVGYDVFIKVLDKICAVSGDDTVTPDEFLSMLSSVMCFEQVGDIPRTKEQVIYGTADRLRPMRPKIAFVLGANHDVFPANTGDACIFSQSERMTMIDNDIAIADFGINDTLNEKFLFYNAVNCASDKIYISYSSFSPENTEMLPSNELNEIISAFPLCQFIKNGSSDLLNIDDIECALPTFEKLAVNFDSDKPIIEALKKYYESDSDFSAKLSALKNSVEGVVPSLSEESARKLFGENLRLSPSKIEDFNRCHFAYFCKHGLKARKLDKADFSAATRGNIIHFCLEHFINAHKDDIGTLNADEIRLEVIKLCDEYLDYVGVCIEDLGDRFDFMLSLLKDTAVIIAVALNNEFAQSGFKPRYCELKIGQKGLVNSIEVTADNGVTVSLEGTVDRVDTTDDGKVRVVDYKTGVKDFKLSAILDGMNMQMLLYLYSLVKNAKYLLSAEIPAGVLYFPARRSASDGFIKMNGLIDADVETINQMETDGAGKIIPVKLRKNGSGFSGTEHTATQDDFNLIFKYLESVLSTIGSKITGGDIEIKPFKTSRGKVCDYCDYRAVCRIHDEQIFREESKGKNAEVLETMKNRLKEGENNGC